MIFYVIQFYKMEYVMKENNNFYYYKAKKAVNLVNSDSNEEHYKHLPNMLPGPDFHNSLGLYFLNATDEIRNCTDEELRFKLRNARVETLSNYLSIIKTTIEDLNNYYKQIYLEFTDDNNGEDLDTYLTDPNTISNFLKFQKKYRNNPLFKHQLSEIVCNAHNYGDRFMEYGAGNILEILQNNIQELRKSFPDENMSYQDAIILYAQLNIYIQEILLNGELIAHASLGRNQEPNLSVHHPIYIEKNELDKLIHTFENTYQELRKQYEEKDVKVLDEDFNYFISTLFPLKVRQEFSPTNKVGISSRELENMFLNIMTYTHENLTNFIQFLLDNKIKLPLSNNKMELFPLYLLHFDNDTIQKAFIIENEEKMVDMDKLRKLILTKAEQKEIKDSLIHLEPKNKEIPIDPFLMEK